jgi:polyketide biosynthesis acyl carrier protein
MIPSKELAMEESTIFASIKRIVLMVVPEIDPEAISMDRSLYDLGCNSIDRAEVMTLTMEELCIAVPASEFRQGDTIGRVVAVMTRHS